MATLLASPVGAELQVGRAFLVDWYRIWNDENGEQCSLTEAQRRFETWQRDASYVASPALQSVQQRFTQAKFESLSHFLRQPTWEATNNGAERTGRLFRHQQAPHFNQRNKDTIAASLTVEACLRKQALTTATRPLHTCQRGRKPGTKLAPCHTLKQCALADNLLHSP